MLYFLVNSIAVVQKERIRMKVINRISLAVFVVIIGAVITSAIDNYLGITIAFKEIGTVAQIIHTAVYGLWGYLIIKCGEQYVKS
jgi:hypothetical protein